MTCHYGTAVTKLTVTRVVVCHAVTRVTVCHIVTVVAWMTGHVENAKLNVC